MRVAGGWNDYVAGTADAQRDYLNLESAANLARVSAEARVVKILERRLESVFVAITIQ